MLCYTLVQRKLNNCYFHVGNFSESAWQKNGGVAGYTEYFCYVLSGILTSEDGSYLMVAVPATVIEWRKEDCWQLLCVMPSTNILNIALTFYVMLTQFLKIHDTKKQQSTLKISVMCY